MRCVLPSLVRTRGEELGLGRRAKRTDFLSLVEACYEEIESDDEWLAQLFESAGPLLDLGGGVGLSLVQERPSERAITLSGGVGLLSEMLQRSHVAIQGLDAETYQGFFYPSKPVVLASSLVAGFAAPARALFASLMKLTGSSDLLGMLGYPAQGWAFAMFVGVGETPLSPRVSKTLGRLRSHVEASIRLRTFSSFDPVAVIRPDGTLLHVDTSALDVVSAEELAAQTAAIEHARSKKGREDAHRAVAVWCALKGGRWSLIDRVDRDGQRHYHAVENGPHVHEQRALTEIEASVLASAIGGRPYKEVAYELGLSQARISEVLKDIAARFGFPDRDALLHTGARLLDVSPPLTREEPLTSAEREVFALIRQRKSNAEIARLRTTSVNTVHRQVSAILRKTGATSRRMLQLLEDPQD